MRALFIRRFFRQQVPAMDIRKFLKLCNCCIANALLQMKNKHEICYVWYPKHQRRFFIDVNSE